MAGTPSLARSRSKKIRLHPPFFTLPPPPPAPSNPKTNPLPSPSPHFPHFPTAPSFPLFLPFFLSPSLPPALPKNGFLPFAPSPLAGARRLELCVSVFVRSHGKIQKPVSLASFFSFRIKIRERSRKKETVTMTTTSMTTTTTTIREKERMAERERESSKETKGTKKRRKKRRKSGKEKCIFHKATESIRGQCCVTLQLRKKEDLCSSVEQVGKREGKREEVRMVKVEKRRGRGRGRGQASHNSKRGKEKNSFLSLFLSF